jgi:Arc/MetJ-type ribon-helix-helix transcriptional regulator
MALDLKKRMISFRLSEEEFERYRALCFNYGVRSVSELARTAINALLEQPTRAQEESLASRVAELEGRIRILSLELRKLSQTARCPETQSVRND